MKNNNAIKVYEELIEKIQQEKLPILITKSTNNEYSLSSDSKYNDELLNMIFKIVVSKNCSFSINRSKYLYIVVTIYNNINNSLVIIQISNLKPDIKNQTLKTFNHNLRVKLLSNIYLTPIIGPDGAGKTTLIDEVIKSSKDKISFYKFTKNYRSSPIYKLLTPFLKKKLLQNTQDTIKIGNNYFDDRSAAFVILNANLMYSIRVITNIFSRKNTLIDRYFHEHLIENKKIKSRKTKLIDNWQSFLTYIPTGYKVIHLDAPTDTILKRKTELEEDTIVAYREDIFKLILAKPFVVYNYINTSKSIDDCKELIVDILKK